MKKVYLELTNRCNLNCIMCYRKSWHESVHDMDGTLLRKCVEEIVESTTVEAVVLGGIGEPVYSKDIFYVTRALKDKHLTITTNGTLMTEELADLLIDCIDEVVISVDGLAENFWAIRGFPLEQVLININALNKRKLERGSKTPNVAVQMVLTKDNYEEAPALVELAEQHDIYKVIYSNVVPASLEDADLVVYKMYEKEPLKGVLDKAILKGLMKKIEIMVPEVMLKSERRCRFIDEDSMMVTVDGYVVPCYRLAHDGTEVVFGRAKVIEAHHFGHVAESSLEEIWQKDDYVNYRSTVYNNQYPSCMDCDMLDGCDMAKNSDMDCWGNVPSCADCLWSRKIVYCV